MISLIDIAHVISIHISYDNPDNPNNPDNHDISHGYYSRDISIHNLYDNPDISHEYLYSFL